LGLGLGLDLGLGLGLDLDLQGKRISHYMQKVKDEAGIRTQTVKVKGESATECATRASNHRLITFIVYFILYPSFFTNSNIIKRRRNKIIFWPLFLRLFDYVAIGKK
jgi:hypothetical protein